MSNCVICKGKRATFTVFDQGNVLMVHSKCWGALEKMVGKINIYGSVAITARTVEPPIKEING